MNLMDFVIFVVPLLNVLIAFFCSVKKCGNSGQSVSDGGGYPGWFHRLCQICYFGDQDKGLMHPRESFGI